MRFFSIIIAVLIASQSYAVELATFQSLGGVVGDTHQSFEIKKVFQDGVYLWVNSTEAATILPEDASKINIIGFSGEVPESFGKVAKHSPTNAVSFTLHQGDMSKPVPANLLLTPTSIFYTQCDFSSPDSALPVIPEGCDSLYIYIRIPLTTGVNSLGAAAPQLNDVGTSWRNGRQFRRIIFERCDLTSQHQISLVQSIEREILGGMGADYASASGTVRWIDFQATTSGANDPLDVPAMEALGWSIDSATIMSKTINGDVWRVFHN